MTPALPRLLAIDAPAGTFADHAARELPELLAGGDLVVVNDAATLPASLRGRAPSGDPVEARLATELDDGRWRAVLFGDGDWRTRTEDRPAPPRLSAGDTLRFDGLTATIDAVDPASERVVTFSFGPRGDRLWRALYRAGRPVQYAHADAPYPLWRVQTAYAARPWSVESPSAGFLLPWERLLALRRRGVGVARLTHAAGLSSTGDAALDERLPFEERYELPESTVEAVARTKAAGRRVVAIGTTVTRSLEGAAASGDGRLRAGPGITDLHLGPATRRAIVDAVVTGLHEPDTSHFRLLEAFAPRPLLERAHAFASARGYRGHEFGDGVLVTSDPARLPGPV